MKRTLPVLALALVVGAAALAGCTPTGRYRDLIFDSATKTTATYGSAPDLVSGATTTLVLDAYQPTGDGLATRPVIVWIHGGGFKGGGRSNLATVATDWARRGYVTFSIDYRLDKGNKCQEVQDGKVPADQIVAETARCKRAIEAAQADTFTALRWIRSKAATYRIDPTRIAVGGGSAGAVTAVHVAERANPTHGPVAADIKVRAALAMSGCNYEPASIDANDAPISLLASGGDQAVPFDCVKATADTAASVGTPVERIYYPTESGHAQGLYKTHQAEVDPKWEEFLITHLGL